MPDTCPSCGTPDVRHGAFYAAGFWGYTCDPANQARDLSGSTLRFIDIDHDVPEHLRQAARTQRHPLDVTCQCCGAIGQYKTLDDALKASWDVPPAFQVTICPGCSSAMFVLGQQADCPHHRRTDG